MILKNGLTVESRCISSESLKKVAYFGQKSTFLKIIDFFLAAVITESRDKPFINFQLSVTCNELEILSSPKSVVFKGTSTLPSSSLSEVFASVLGYSVNQGESWDGLVLKDPFNLASAVVAVVVEGAESLNFKVR